MPIARCGMTDRCCAAQVTGIVRGWPVAAILGGLSDGLASGAMGIDLPPAEPSFVPVEWFRCRPSSPRLWGGSLA
jgi:hypothetical protein